MKPTTEDVKNRLRVVGDILDSQVNELIDQVHDEMVHLLNGNLVPSESEFLAADPATRPILFKKDLITAQILLIGFYLDSVGTQDGERQKEAALEIINRHRNLGV